MTEVTYNFSPIGTIHSPHQDIKGMPIQPPGAEGIRGTIEILPQYQQGLTDLEGFSHLFLLYVFHRITTHSLMVTPFLDSQPRGVFATRTPKRPNPIGLSVVKLIGIEDGVLQIENVDILDGTPLLDLKPYVPDFDAAQDVRTGWFNGRSGNARTYISDDRFRD